MNDNSIEINRYLQHEMSEAEKAAFEDQLAKDNALQQELQVQRQIMNAAVHAGVKAEFAKAIRTKVILKRTLTWGTIIVVCVVAVLVHEFRHSVFPALGFGDSRQVETNISAKITRPFIDPPLAAIDVPLSVYNFNAEKGDTIFHPSGTVIYFPPSALVDGSGIPVKGNVRITYREFADPVDFFVSGIPMGYDSAGVDYDFESSGMCEIYAYKDNNPVFVNKNAPPEINLSVKNKSLLHNVYFLDTVNRKWNYMGKDIVTEVKNIVPSNSISTTALSFENNIPVKPVKPSMASVDKPAFSIEIDPGSFEELFAYDRLKFQVEDESSYRRSDANEHWENVKLEHAFAESIYTVTFTNSKRKVSYKVRPVLEAADYEAALKIFKQKNAAYEQALKNRVVKEQAESDSIDAKNKRMEEKMNADNTRNIKINNFITERNKKVRELRKRSLTETEKANAGNQLLDEDQVLLMEMDPAKYAGDMRSSAEIMRTFAVNRFGVWNCDFPLNGYGGIAVFSSFKDSLGNTIFFSGVAVVYGGMNGISQFPSTQIRIIPGKENMIWGIEDSTFFYFTYKDFEAANIDRNAKTFTFRMRSSKKKISTYNEIRELVGKL
jgi:hypothetical protein